MTDRDLLEQAIDEAQLGLREGGLPIGAVLADMKQGTIIARGHNLRVQQADPTAHAETVCIRHAGRRRDWRQLTLASTLSPCIMCAGTAMLYHIPRIVVGDNQNFQGAENHLEQAGIQVVRLNDARCIAMMRTFIAEHPDLWHEDIGV